MPIYGISDFKRLPRLGKIKLGKKDESRKGAPVQTRYFVCPEEVQAVYGPQPKELDIMFPLNDIEIVFPQYMKLYGKTGLKCKGNGHTAMAMIGGNLVEKTCAPNSPDCKGCKPIGTLNFLLPKVPGFGVWQIWTSSWNSIVNLNSSIDMIKAMTGGKIAFIPLKLQLQEHSATITQEDGKQFQKKVFVMTLNIAQTMDQFYQEYSLEANQRRALQNPGLRNLIQANNVLAGLPSPTTIQSFDDDDDEEWEVEEPQIESSEEHLEQQEKVQKLACYNCGVEISKTVAEYSSKNYGRHLCMPCQKKQLNLI